MPSNIAIFASGNGSNAQAIIEYFKGRDDINVDLIASNRAEAGVLQRAEKEGIEAVILNKTNFPDTENLIAYLRERNIELIILAGYLKLIPSKLIEAFPNQIINIHPALLPKYGGKGMYGINVHRAVKAQNEKESGITIHFVNEHYDEGEHILQEKVEILPNDSPEEIASKVLKLEHYHFPRVIDKLLTDVRKSDN